MPGTERVDEILRLIDEAIELGGSQVPKGRARFAPGVRTAAELGALSDARVHAGAA